MGGMTRSTITDMTECQMMDDMRGDTRTGEAQPARIDRRSGSSRLASSTSGEVLIAQAAAALRANALKRIEELERPSATIR